MWSAAVALVFILVPASGNSACPLDCSSRGTCHDGRCQCQEGYVGVDCAGSCPNNCTSRGECVLGECSCAQGYAGDDCSIVVCANDCSGHGICSGNLECSCNEGWTGHDCSLQTCPNDCARHGNCYNGTCYCDPGYLGADCSIGSCPGNCSASLGQVSEQAQVAAKETGFPASQQWPPN